MKAVRRIEIVGAGLAVAATLAAGSATPLVAHTAEQWRLVYHATFGGGSLDSGVDLFGIGPLSPGDSQVPNTNPTWMADAGTMKLSITRDAAITVGPVGAGLFATPVNFDQGSVFRLRATFVEPVGPHDPGNIWAVTVGARTGDQDDLGGEIRTAATFQVRGSGARLNVLGASAPAGLPNVPQVVYDAIFDPTNPRPFTLELLVDRTSGRGEACLTIENWKFVHSFELAVFQAHSGPSITAVGISIAISNASGQTASVRARNLQIFSIRP